MLIYCVKNFVDILENTKSKHASSPNTCANINTTVGHLRVLVPVGDKFWQLKESAKWSLDMSERMHAIRQLAENYGPKAIQSIAEIRDVAAYKEIRDACKEAIKAASAKSSATPSSRRKSGIRSTKAKKGKRKI